MPLVLSVTTCAQGRGRGHRGRARGRGTGTKLPFAIGNGLEGCDLFNGRWVRDETRPLYTEDECPYIQRQLTCQTEGRRESDYLKWRWQPYGCSLPKFNATTMLEALRGKKLMFVGDSINRGQYLSFICLLQSVIPENAKSFSHAHFPNNFTAKEYDTTISFSWAPYLVESNADDPEKPIDIKIVRNNSIDVHGPMWVGHDILIFDTYFWWVNMTGRTFRVKQGPGSFEDTTDIIKVPTEAAYGMAIENMLGWAKKHMNFQKTRLFMMSMSPVHRESWEWGGSQSKNCYQETTIIQDPTYWGFESRKSIMQVIGDVISKSKVPVSFINITQLASYRKDAHTSIYKQQWHPLSPQQLADPVSYADCVHWCVPGISDTFNELLYTKLFYP